MLLSLGPSWVQKSQRKAKEKERKGRQGKVREKVVKSGPGEILVGVHHALRGVRPVHYFAAMPSQNVLFSMPFSASIFDDNLVIF